jgi:hypothetical protein
MMTIPPPAPPALPVPPPVPAPPLPVWALPEGALPPPPKLCDPPLLWLVAEQLIQPAASQALVNATPSQRGTRARYTKHLHFGR